MASSTPTRAIRAAANPRAARAARSVRDAVAGYLFVGPFLLAYVAFLLWPFARGVWISLHDWNLLAVAINPDAKTFVGLENYVRMLWGDGLTWSLEHQWAVRAIGLAGVAVALWAWRTRAIGRGAAVAAIVAGLLVFGVALGVHPGEDGRWGDRRFWPIVGNTLSFVALTVPVVAALGLGLAIGLNRDDRLSAVLRTAFFLSQVLSVTVVTLIGVIFTAGELFADLPAWFRPGVVLTASVGAVVLGAFAFTVCESRTQAALSRSDGPRDCVPARKSTRHSGWEHRR